jgi:predicted nucleic acid-binding protein
MTPRSISGDAAVLLDTSAFFVLFNQTDASHGAAQALVRRLNDERRPVVTTNFVVAELHALLLRRAGRNLALQALKSLEQGGIVVVRVDVEDERRAREIIDRYDDKDFSLVDALSFAVMERLGIATAFAFDRHFAQFGWTVLGAPDS